MPRLLAAILTVSLVILLLVGTGVLVVRAIYRGTFVDWNSVSRALDSARRRVESSPATTV